MLDEPRRLSFSWGFPDIPDTWVDIRLRRIAGGTHVRLIHSGWDQFEERESEAMRGGLGVSLSRPSKLRPRVLVARVGASAPGGRAEPPRG